MGLLLYVFCLLFLLTKYLPVSKWDIVFITSPLISQDISASPLIRTQNEAVSPSVTIAGRGVLTNCTGNETSVTIIFKITPKVQNSNVQLYLLQAQYI